MDQQLDRSQLETRALRLVEAAQKAGATAADAVAVTGSSLGVNVRDGKVEGSERSESNAVSLRVFVGQRVASVSTNSDSNLDELAARAVEMAKVTPEDPYAGLADENRLLKHIPQLDLCDPRALSADELRDKALEAEAAALEVAGVTKSGGAGASWGLGGLVLATSHGFLGSYERSRSGVSATAIAGEGTQMERDYDFDSRTYVDELASAHTIGTNAGKRAVARLNPRKIETCKAPIYYEPRMAGSLLGHFAGAISGTAIARGTSFLKERMGEQVFGKHIQIIDDPHKPRSAATTPFDGEGTAAQTLRLIEDGRLTSWLLDSASARELGLQPNGRARHTGSSTSPSITNLTLQAGDISPEELFRQIGDGLLVTSLIGHGANGITGDYSRGASGFWVENGEAVYPVSEITIAGNMKDMFMQLTPASDLDDRYAVAAPTVAVEGMTIAGA
ncbi:TldD/PmbA family protein [Polycladidibacter hongkongensis]|uniref:TldD/PmbA family protein n=1 Tax=Polycladidibacter hongkongensis TaxID=1647556 RepID=UPI000834224B|nr:TldD/PmbA family protein [Pseudovibrio hongkongensis]